MSQIRRWIVAVVLAGLIGASCATTMDVSKTLSSSVGEQKARVLPLTGDVTNPAAQISGMAWYGDYLILLPQYPNFPDEGSHGRLFAIPKADILAVVNDPTRGPLVPRAIGVYTKRRSSIGGYEGYEALVFDGNKAYLTIESELKSGASEGYLIAASMAPDLSVFTIEDEYSKPIPSRSKVENMAEETLLLIGDRVITIHEANGTGAGIKNASSPAAHVFNPKRLTESPKTIPFPSIPYRITDATALDDKDRFWAINYFFEGDKNLRTSDTPLFDKYGRGPSHARSEGVERLVEFQYAKNGITLTGTPPIQLELLPKGGRNWEGIVRLDNLGFLLVTDEHPGTLLAFVPKP